MLGMMNSNHSSCRRNKTDYASSSFCDTINSEELNDRIEEVFKEHRHNRYYSNSRHNSKVTKQFHLSSTVRVSLQTELQEQKRHELLIALSKVSLKHLQALKGMIKPVECVLRIAYALAAVVQPEQASIIKESTWNSIQSEFFASPGKMLNNLIKISQDAMEEATATLARIAASRETQNYDNCKINSASDSTASTAAARLQACSLFAESITEINMPGNQILEQQMKDLQYFVETFLNFERVRIETANVINEAALEQQQQQLAGTPISSAQKNPQSALQSSAKNLSNHRFISLGDLSSARIEEGESLYHRVNTSPASTTQWNDSSSPKQRKITHTQSQQSTAVSLLEYSADEINKHNKRVKSNKSKENVIRAAACVHSSSGLSRFQGKSAAISKEQSKGTSQDLNTSKEIPMKRFTKTRPASCSSNFSRFSLKPSVSAGEVARSNSRKQESSMKRKETEVSQDRLAAGNNNKKDLKARNEAAASAKVSRLDRILNLKVRKPNVQSAVGKEVQRTDQDKNRRNIQQQQQQQQDGKRTTTRTREMMDESLMESNRISRHNNSSLSQDRRRSDLSNTSNNKKNNNNNNNNMVHQQMYLGKQPSISRIRNNNNNTSNINMNDKNNAKTMLQQGENTSINRSCSIDELKASLAKEIASEKKQAQLVRSEDNALQAMIRRSEKIQAIKEQEEQSRDELQHRKEMNSRERQIRMQRATQEKKSLHDARVESIELKRQARQQARVEEKQFNQHSEERAYQSRLRAARLKEAADALKDNSKAVRQARNVKKIQHAQSIKEKEQAHQLEVLNGLRNDLKEQTDRKQHLQDSLQHTLNVIFNFRSAASAAQQRTKGIEEDMQQ